MNIKDSITIRVGSLELNQEEWDVVDQITNKGLNALASKLGSNTTEESWMSFIAIGNGLSVPSTEDETLVSEIFRKRGTVTIIDNTYFVEAEFGRDEPTQDMILREVGIFDAISGGNLGARWLLVDEVLKEYDDVIYIKIAISMFAGE
jgi:hypothetical protein